MPTPVWQPGTIYAPGSLVQPASTPAPVADQLTNPDFELGNTGWTLDAGFSIGQFGNGTHFQGTWSLQWDSSGNGYAVNNNATEVTPGQTINASCQVQQGSSSSGDAGARVEILWYDASDELLGTSSKGNLIDSGSNQNWKQSSVAAIAPAGAAFARFAVFAFRSAGGAELWVDTCTWDAIVSALPTGLVFKAVQAVAGFSGATEPVWPLVNGQTVIDNEVTWEAVFTSRVVWEATPILVSGEYEPEWPTVPGGEVADGTIRWVAMTWRITDAKCPQSPIVAIGASKIFNFDDDIIAYSATTNPLDWSSEEDAGFLPFGLRTYGGSPGTALGLYRGNLLAFNGEGYQMWQIDEDPANMANLDASPIPCTFEKGGAPVSNDFALVTPVGVRSIGIAGASVNLQAGYFGAQIDPLVQQKLLAEIAPLTLTWPAAGQWWAVFDDEAFVLTMNGGQKDWSWSRYIFPYGITDWAILDGDLYLRTDTDLVWKMDAETHADDVICSPDAPVLEGSVEDVGEAPDIGAVLEWNVPEGAVLFRLYNADTQALIIETDGTTYTQTGLEVGETYRYYVTALGANEGESEPSNTLELTVDLPSAPILSGAVEDLGGGSFTFALEWTASTPPSYVDGYRLYDASDDTLIVQQAGLTYDDTPYGLGVTKSFYVRAYGPGGAESLPSNTLILDTANEGVIVDIFTSSSLWTKRPGLISVDVEVIGAGGAGAGGGAARGTGQPISGAGGGGGGRSFVAGILAASLGSTETVTVGEGGLGGAGAVATSGVMQGSRGTDGGDSSFGAHASASGGQRGGNSSISVGGTGGAGTTEAGGDGGDGATSNMSGGDEHGFPGDNTSASGAGGGGGGPLKSFATPGEAGEGGSTSGEAGGSGGAGQVATNAVGGGGSAGGDSADSGGGGGGGGGCAGSQAAGGDATAGNGGDGGSYGGGGGGGGAAQSDNGSGDVATGGNGGDGGDGVVIVTNYIAV